MKKIKLVLSNYLDCFKNFEDGHLLNVVRFSSYKTYRKERALFYQDDMANAVYLLVQGNVRRVIWKEDSTSEIMGMINEGIWIGLPETIVSGPYLYDAITNEDSELIYLHRKNLLNLMKIDVFHKMINEELALGYYSLFAQMQTQNPFQKIITYIKSSIETFEKKDTDSNNYIIEITQEDLADALGITRITVGKYLRQLQDDNIINLSRGKIEIIDFEKLSNT